MTDVERVLGPLREQDAEIGKLDTYASAGDLADAIVSVHAALDRSVRLLLRTDADAPEDARMSALAADTPLDRVITVLRRRDRVSMRLAGRLHESETIARRIAEGGTAGPSDADAVRSAVQLLRDEVRRPAADRPAAVPPSVSPFSLEEDIPVAEPEGGRGRSLAVSLLVLVLLAVLVAVVFQRGGGEREAALESFRAGDLAGARTQLEAVLADDPADVTALLYLARIHRREGRLREAAAALETAVGTAPGDADVRRELGWLFLDLGRPEPAIEQFRLARDAEPEVSSNWIGLVRALREAGDPSAAEVLRQAPPDVRAALGEGAG